MFQAKTARTLFAALLAFGFLTALTETARAAEDINAGKGAAAVCAGCHGPKGVSMNPIWPNLAGQKKEYLTKQIKAFQDGSRKDPLMSPVSKTLNENDVANVAAYFASLKAE